jgi:hypothetical protein
MSSSFSEGADLIGVRRAAPFMAAASAEPV